MPATRRTDRPPVENQMVANLISKTFGQSFDWPLASAMAMVHLAVLFALITAFNRFVCLDEVFN